MASNDNLIIKFGQKSGTGNAVPINNATKSAGSIYAAKNSIGGIEMYLDTPEGSNTERKRLDPSIFAGSLDDAQTPSSVQSGATDAEVASAKEAAIRANYNVWMDTSLKMSMQVVTNAYWNDTTQTSGVYNSPGNKNDTTNLNKLLTIVVPDSASEDYDATNNPHPKTRLIYLNTMNIFC